MKKMDVINLIKHHYEKDNDAFYDLAYKIAKEFDDSGDSTLAQYIESLLTKKYNLVPQQAEIPSIDESIMKSIDTTMRHQIYLPTQLGREIEGLTNSLLNNKGINKILFFGAPGTGKTEMAKYIANAVKKKLYIANFSMLVDSRLGETPKNIEKLFASINHTFDLNRTIFFFDELDVIALDRINKNDLREMGRTTSTFIKCMDNVNPDAIIIATTNLANSLDPAVKRRFEYELNFDCYDKEFLAEISVDIVKEYKTTQDETGEFKLVSKMVEKSTISFSPAELRNYIKISLAFSDERNPISYINRLFIKLFPDIDINHHKYMNEVLGFTIRDISLITGIPKSSIAREIGGNHSGE